MSSHSKASSASNVIRTSNSFFFGVIFACLAAGASQSAMAQKTPEVANMPDFAPAMIEHAQKMRRYRDPDRGVEHIPPVINRFIVDRDPKGAIASFQPNGATITSNNAFFKDMGTNGRTCFTCHRPENGWSITPQDVVERFEKSRGTDPVFRLVDGATCVKSILVSTLPNDGMVETAPIKVLQQNGANVFNIELVRRALVAALVAAVLSMGLAVAADEIIGTHLDAQKSDVSRRLGEHRAAFRRNGFSDAPSDQFTLERKKHEMPPSVIVLEALSHILPDHTYATELRIEGDKLQMVGITRDAPSLIRLIEQSPQFARATFFAPTTRSSNDPGERFHIEVRIRPAFTVQR